MTASYQKLGEDDLADVVTLLCGFAKDLPDERASGGRCIARRNIDHSLDAQKQQFIRTQDTLANFGRSL